jgi:hypothetical protein
VEDGGLEDGLRMVPLLSFSILVELFHGCFEELFPLIVAFISGLSGPRGDELSVSL